MTRIRFTRGGKFLTIKIPKNYPILKVREMIAHYEAKGWKR